MLRRDVTYWTSLQQALRRADAQARRTGQRHRVRVIGFGPAWYAVTPTEALAPGVVGEPCS